jgi:hypothetical protein
MGLWKLEVHMEKGAIKIAPFTFVILPNTSRYPPAISPVFKIRSGI